MIESVIIGITRIANTSRETSVNWEEIVRHPFTKKRIDLPVFDAKKKENCLIKNGIAIST